MKVLLDSSVLVSAFLIPRSNAGELLRKGIEGRFEPCVSRDIVNEIGRSLHKKSRLRARYRYRDEDVDQYTDDLMATMTLCPAFKAIAPVCRDPFDDHVLAAAQAVGASFIVTGDKDLLSMSQYRKIKIVTIRAFLDGL